MSLREVERSARDVRYLGPRSDVSNLLALSTCSCSRPTSVREYRACSWKRRLWGFRSLPPIHRMQGGRPRRLEWASRSSTRPAPPGRGGAAIVRLAGRAQAHGSRSRTHVTENFSLDYVAELRGDLRARPARDVAEGRGPRCGLTWPSSSVRSRKNLRPPPTRAWSRWRPIERAWVAPSPGPRNRDQTARPAPPAGDRILPVAGQRALAGREGPATRPGHSGGPKRRSANGRDPGRSRL